MYSGPKGIGQIGRDFPTLSKFGRIWGIGVIEMKRLVIDRGKVPMTKISRM